ncbi:MAG: N-acetylmuramoyl-L-alanine amidase [Thermodesulfobacteriota bacterium]|nr:N-acetylmuramoyl-L-alanine amidase [Thermodesulfobacteriota bacterium]
MCHKKFIKSCLLVIWVVAILQICVSCAVTSKNRYFKAEACYYDLRKNIGSQKYRHNWLRCIKKFKEVYKQDPSDPWAPAGMYMSGKLYGELYEQSHRKSDKQEAINVFRRIIKRYPKSRYRTKAAAAIRTLETNASKRVTHASKTKKKYAPAKPPTKSSTGKAVDNTTTVTGLRYWSNPTYTRVVIDASRETSFTHRLLKKDPAINKPQRLYVDLKNSIRGKNIEKFTPINDNLLRDVRAGQYTPNVVRVVVDIKSIKTYKIFSLKHPFRVVLDLSGDSMDTWFAAKSQKKATATTIKKLTKGVSAKQPQRDRPLIVVDPGHGGHDFGSSGYLKKVYEKDITLQIAGRLAKKIRKKLPYEVLMTRNSDRYLTLEERTAIANTKNADLFISIHTNDSGNQSTYGIETYFLNLATENSEITVAARENATSTKNISDLQTILTDIMQNTKIDESSLLANYIQDSSCNYLRSRYAHIKNKGVKMAPFYVLLGARMPAVLIETSFISNPRECKRLTSARYQEQLCEGILNGIQKYVEESRSAS